MKPRNTEPQSSNPEDRARRQWEATRCSWTTNGRGCLLTGSSSPDTGGITKPDGTVSGPKALCPWHADRIGGGQGSGDSREFDAWLEMHRTQFPAKVYGQSDYTRFTNDTLWDAIVGNSRLPSIEKPRTDSRPASARERANAFAKIGAMLDGKFSAGEA